MENVEEVEQTKSFWVIQGIEFQKKYEKQKEINKELVDENESLKKQIEELVDKWVYWQNK